MSKDHKGTSEFCALTTTSKDEGSTLKEQMHSCDCDEWLSKHHLLFRFCSNEGRKMSAKQILAFETKLQCVIVSEGIWTVDHFWTCQWSSWCKVNCAMMQISSSGNVNCWWTKSLHPQSWDKAAQWQPEDDNQRMTSNVLSGWCEAGLEKHQLFWQMCLPQWFLKTCKSKRPMTQFQYQYMPGSNSPGTRTNITKGTCKNFKKSGRGSKVSGFLVPPWARGAVASGDGKMKKNRELSIFWSRQDGKTWTRYYCSSYCTSSK